MYCWLALIQRRSQASQYQSSGLLPILEEAFNKVAGNKHAETRKFAKGASLIGDRPYR